MKNLLIALIVMVSFSTNSFSTNSSKKGKNPLLETFNTAFETPPFSLIKHEHFIPAFKAAMEEGKKDIEQITSNTERPDFKNTIENMSYSGAKLELISNIFFNLNHADTDEKMQDIAREISPLLSDYNTDILFNKKLFERVKTVYEKKDSMNLSPEQLTLLDKTYKGFSRNGAALSDEKKERLRQISRDLSVLGLKFNDNVLAETNSWFLHITEENDLSGLPETAIEAAKEAAVTRELEGWVITLQIPSAWPFMHYADNRELRKKVYTAYTKRGYNGNEHDNTDIMLKIANLRLERANILGYDSHAEFVLEERMAETPDAVNDFIKELAAAAKPIGLKDLEDVQQFANKLGFEGKIQYWDWYYYAEKKKNKLFDFDEEEVRPYLQLENVKKGIFTLCELLWGISFTPNNEIDVYHSEVTAYEVHDHDGSLLSILYLDFFPRPGKSPGAWMTSYRSQYREGGESVLPHISIVCNFTRPTSTRPSLLTYNEFTTFLHEFGHALHGIFSDVTYPDLSGTSVYRDFVELPSQVMENWAFEKEFLDMVAVHYETGEKIPNELVQKVIDSKNFHSAFTIMRQLTFGLTDMAWHSITKPLDVDPEKFEMNAMAPAYIFPIVEGTMMSSSFAHIFSGGYAAGYYGYKWAEVLDADAFEAFKENGIFDRKTADLFREHILSKGGTEHPIILYKRFRGAEPILEPYLRREGLL